MDFEWKQRVIFTFVLAVPILAIANPALINKQVNGIRWSKNPEKVRETCIVQYFYYYVLPEVCRLP